MLVRLPGRKIAPANTLSVARAAKLWEVRAPDQSRYFEGIIMTSDTKALTPASIEFVGSTTDGSSHHVDLPKFRDEVVARINAWAMGYADAEHPGSTAFLKLTVNGKEVGDLKDANFNLYSLQIERAVIIPANTETKVEMKSGNRLATQAGDPAHGLVVSVEST